MYYFFFFNDTATTEIYTLSLHDALPISVDRTATTVGTPNSLADLFRATSDLNLWLEGKGKRSKGLSRDCLGSLLGRVDRKSTRLNSSHANISYAVFCLKKKNR